LRPMSSRKTAPVPIEASRRLITGQERIKRAARRLAGVCAIADATIDNWARLKSDQISNGKKTRREPNSRAIGSRGVVDSFVR